MIVTNTGLASSSRGNTVTVHIEAWHDSDAEGSILMEYPAVCYGFLC